MAAPLTPEQRQQLRRRCTLVVPGFGFVSAAQDFRQLADWCEAQGVEHDVYGDGALVAGFEHKLAALLGQPAAVFMPSGVMAQLSAVRIWTEAARLPRFGLHPTSHLLLHEEEAYAALLQAHAVPIGDRLRPMLAGDLAACRQPLACVVVELPIREAGGQLPSWDELEALKAAARARGVRLHMDGARLWESAACYGRPHAEIAAGFDSVYVSVYKGIGGLAGAVLAGSDDFIAQARRWRRRLGGTLVHLSPLVASAAMRFDERLALMPALYRRTLALAAQLAPLARLRVNPAVPQTNMLHLYFEAPAEAALAARDALALQAGAWLFDRVRPAEVPGWSLTEISIGDRLLQADPARVAEHFAQLDAALAGHGR
ncbi:MAG: threonine aldolase [Burkholderiales bacterium]|nr:threonine aldolase [Burkholderiales bacterium]